MLIALGAEVASNIRSIPRGVPVMSAELIERNEESHALIVKSRRVEMKSDYRLCGEDRIRLWNSYSASYKLPPV